MSRFIKGESRSQITLFPEAVDEYIEEDNPVRVIDVFVDDLDLSALGFKTEPADTGRPAYHPGLMLKLFIYGYLNRVQSSRRLEREAGRNVELMWLLGRLAPDFKTIADFRKNNTKAISRVCREFVLLCRQLDLFADSLIAIDGSKFKAVNNRNRNFTRAKIKHRLKQIDEIKACDEAGIKTYLPKPQTSGNQARGYYGKRDFIYHPKDDEYECPAGERAIYRFTREENGKMIRRYWSSACTHCSMKSQCTTGKYRRISRWEHESILDDLEDRMERAPDMMKVRRSTVEHHLWDHQVLDGVDALPDEDDPAGQCGDELACAGIQPETGHKNPRHQTVDRSDPGLGHFDFRKVAPSG